MNHITLVLAYYENPSMLRRQFADVRALPAGVRDRLRVIVVDDGSPTAPAALDAPLGCALTIYRMGVDIRWNQDACRNIGAHHAATKWLLLTDMDHRIPPKTWRYCMQTALGKRTAYTFRRVTETARGTEPYKPHPNSWLLSRALYDAVGGYDERFAGWYGTDGDFKVRLGAAAKGFQQLPVPLVRVPREITPDASTTRYDRKTADDKINIKRIFAERSLDADHAPRRLTFPYTEVFRC